MQLIGALSGGRSMPSEMDWFDSETVARNADYLAENYIDPATSSSPWPRTAPGCSPSPRSSGS